MNQIRDDKQLQISEPPVPLEIEETETEPKINQKYLLLVTFSCSLSIMQFGGAVSASGQNFTQFE